MIRTSIYKNKFSSTLSMIAAGSILATCSPLSVTPAMAEQQIGQSCTANTGIETTMSSIQQEGVIQCIPDGNGNYWWQAEGGVARYDATGGCSVAGTLRWNGSAIQYCDGGNWQPIGGTVPSGTICGMQTNGDNFGPRCQGYAPYDSSCPPGYSLNVWRVSFGNGWFMFCVKD